MKKSKIICLIICILMILTVFPVVGFPIQTGKVNNSNITQPHYQAPTPGYAPIPPLDSLTDVINDS